MVSACERATLTTLSATLRPSDRPQSITLSLRSQPDGRDDGPSPQATVTRARYQHRPATRTKARIHSFGRESSGIPDRASGTLDGMRNAATDKASAARVSTRETYVKSRARYPHRLASRLG